MYSVEEVADKLNVSKVTVYAKLKKFDDMVVIKQNKKYVTEELLSLIKKDLKVKEIEHERVSSSEYKEYVNAEIAIDRDDLVNLNKDLINTLIEQLKVKDKQLEEKDKQIKELHKLIENSQVLLKEEQKHNQSQLLLEEHFKEVDLKLQSIMQEKRERHKKKKKWKLF